MKNLLKTALALTSIMMLVLAPSPLQASPTQPNEKELLKIVDAAISDQLAVLTNAPGKRVSVDVTSYSAANSEKLTKESQHRAYLASHDLSYTGFRTDIRPLSMSQLGNNVILTVTEHTTMTITTIPKDPLAPAYYEYEQNHQVRFTLSGNRWVMVNQEPIKSPYSNDVLPNLSPPNTANVSPSNSVAVAAVAAVNHNNVVAYARKYWNNYNTSYKSFSSDCTNFVSQAMAAGGWSQTFPNPLFYKNTNQWWYTFILQTYSWVGVNEFYAFLSTTGRGYTALTFRALMTPGSTFFKAISPGDVVQIDTNNDGKYDHSMIVTTKDSYGRLYITEHTSNHLDKPLLDIIYQYSGATLRAIHIY